MEINSLTERGYLFIEVFYKFMVVLLFCLYLIILSKQILFKFLPLQVIVDHITLNFEGETFWHSHNFIPFKTISYYLFTAADMNLVYVL